MGVIDNDAERLAAVHALHPARHAFYRGESRPHPFAVEPQGIAEGDRGQGVANVEAPGELQFHDGAPARGGNVDSHCPRTIDHFEGTHVGRYGPAIRQDAGAG